MILSLALLALAPVPAGGTQPLSSSSSSSPPSFLSPPGLPSWQGRRVPPHSHWEEEEGEQWHSPLTAPFVTRHKKTRLHSALPKDYYDRLGLGRGASVEEVKRAYRSLSIRYHPEWNHEPDAETQYQELKEAYQILTDEQKRRVYDEEGEEGLRQKFSWGHSGGRSWQDFAGYHREEDLGASVNHFFKGTTRRAGASVRNSSRRRARGWPGGDIRVDLSIPLKASVVGSHQTIRVNHLCGCGACSGTGIKPDARVNHCSRCGGMGAIVQLTRTALGTFQTRTTCPQCAGTGQVVEEFCGSCAGQGRVERSKSVRVYIPPGVEHGTKLRIRGEGDAGLKGGEPGDLYVYLAVDKHPTFTRHGLDLYSQITVSWIDAMLGARIKVPSLHDEDEEGKATEVVLKEGTQPGVVIRLEGQGVPHLDTGSRGDHYVTVAVSVPQPQQVGPMERQLLQQLRKVRTRSSSVASSGPSSSSPSSTGSKSDGKRMGFFRRLGLSF